MTRSIWWVCLAFGGCDAFQGPGGGPDDLPDFGVYEPPADADGDGLSDAREAELGTDPNDPDSDDDGLTDGEEDRAGTNPLAADTDHDTYEDGWERAEGTDPLDPGSRIYTGYWPYQPLKDDFDSDAADQATIDTPTPRLGLDDQFGEAVDLYDFAGHDTPVLVALLNPKNPYFDTDIARILAGQESEYLVNFYDAPWLDGLGPRIAAGELQVVTVLYNVTEAPERAAFAARFPVRGMPALSDTSDGAFYAWAASGGLPALILLEPDLTVATVGDPTSVLDATWERVKP